MAALILNLLAARLQEVSSKFLQLWSLWSLDNSASPLHWSGENKVCMKPSLVTVLYTTLQQPQSHYWLDLVAMICMACPRIPSPDNPLPMDYHPKHTRHTHYQHNNNQNLSAHQNQGHNCYTTVTISGTLAC